MANEDLKIEMKQKIYDLIIENGIFFNGVQNSIELFNNDEIKMFLNREFDNNILECLSTEENLKCHFGEITIFMNFLIKANDVNWQYDIIKKILNIIVNYSNELYIVKIVEANKYNSEIYNRLKKDYYSYFPEVYKNYLKMNEDPNYVYNKSLKFMEEDIDIGIDTRISIGPEIEANNDYNIEIDIYNQNGFNEYRVDKDATVPNGSEIVPRTPFHNTKEDVAKFCGLCESMKDMGYYYNESSGNASGQINLGIDYLDTKEAILNFYEIYGNCEELLYYISSEEGQLFRQDVYVNSRIKPISEIIGKRALDEQLTRDDVIKMFNSTMYDNDTEIKGLEYKKNSVCLRGTCKSEYRLEFRIPNGGCNYRTWIDNIRLYGKMMEVAKKLADAMKKDYLTEEEEYLLKLKIDLQDETLDLEEKLIILMNLLFKDVKIKQIYYNRYISTIKKIEETNSKKYKNKYYLHEPSFDVVEFQDEYKSRLDIDYEGDSVIEYDPELGIIENNRKK